MTPTFGIDPGSYDYGPNVYKHLAFPFTITIVEDQGIHVTLDDFVPKVLVEEFLTTISVRGRGPEYDILRAALDA